MGDGREGEKSTTYSGSGAVIATNDPEVRRREQERLAQEKLDRQPDEADLVDRIWCHGTSRGNFPVYGVTVPKEKFLELFTGEKGEWPTDQEVTEKLKKRFGHHMPSWIDGGPNGSQEEGYYGPEAFLNNDDRIGVRFLGDIRNENFDGRVMSYEIQQRSIGRRYDLRDLRTILNVRADAFAEMGGSPTQGDTTLDLETLYNYLKGKWLGAEYKTHGDMRIIEGTNAYMTKLVETFREIGLPELPFEEFPFR